MSERKSNIYTKIQAVANDIKGIEKDTAVRDGGNTYKAVSDMSVILKVKEAEFKHGLLSIPYKQELVKSEILNSVPAGDGVRVTYVDTIKMTTKIIDLDNPSDYLEVESYGRGVDDSDKGFGKASTYARKYALLNVYKIATGVDPDSTNAGAGAPDAIEPHKAFSRVEKIAEKKRGVKKSNLNLP